MVNGNMLSRYNIIDEADLAAAVPKRFAANRQLRDRRPLLPGPRPR